MANGQNPPRNLRNRNPGNLRYGDFASQRGATGADDRGMAIFPSSALGFKAMVELLAGDGYAQLSLAQAVARYAPASDDNHPNHYAEVISGQTGIALERLLGQLSASELAALAWAMAMFEGWPH